MATTPWLRDVLLMKVDLDARSSGQKSTTTHSHRRVMAPLKMPPSQRRVSLDMRPPALNDSCRGDSSSAGAIMQRCRWKRAVQHVHIRLHVGEEGHGDRANGSPAAWSVVRGGLSQAAKATTARLSTRNARLAARSDRRSAVRNRVRWLGGMTAGGCYLRIVRRPTCSHCLRPQAPPTAVL